MYKTTVKGIEVPECSVEFSSEGKITLQIPLDFTKLDALKALPVGGPVFAINAETELVSLLFKACSLVSFDLNGQTMDYNPETGSPKVARLVFDFKSE